MCTAQIIVDHHSTAIRGWLRLLARFIDILILATVVGFISGIVFPYNFEISDLFGTTLILFSWLLLEAVLLCTWGTTPGKWLLGIVIQTTNGHKLNFQQALRRSFSVWLKGLGMGLPLISIVTLIFSYYQFIHYKITSWDRDGDFLIGYHKTGMFKTVFVIIFYSAFVALLYWQ